VATADIVLGRCGWSGRNWLRGEIIMARIPRKFLIETAEVGVYHCINRCVRRAFLCGSDVVSGKNFDHRKQWIQDRLEFLAGVFGLDVMGFAVLSNALHLVLRNRPDVEGEKVSGTVSR
jgi:hypothetical protein